MGAADEAHKDRPDADLVEDSQQKGTRWRKRGGATVRAPTECGATSPPTARRARLAGVRGVATQLNLSPPWIIFLWVALNAITSDQKSASNAFNAIESSLSLIPTLDHTVCGSQPIIQSEANGTGFWGPDQ